MQISIASEQSKSTKTDFVSFSRRHEISDERENWLEEWMEGCAVQIGLVFLSVPLLSIYSSSFSLCGLN